VFSGCVDWDGRDVENPVRHEPASLNTYLAILRRRAWIIVICAVTVPAVVYFVSRRETPQYAASADVFVNEQNLASALTGINTGGLSFGQAQSVDTDASLAAVPAVAARALYVAKLHDRSPETLLGQTTITPNLNTNIVDFMVTDSSPANAQLLATSYARAFARYRNELDSQPVVRARQELEKTMATLVAEGRKGSALYESLAEKDQELQTLQTLQTGGAVVIRTATPGAQVSPHTKRNTAIGLVLGLILGIGLAFAAEALDTRVRSTGELSEELGGLPLLARLPSPAKKLQKRDELVMVAQPKHNAAEAFRLLRANLEFVRLTGNDPVRTILITSAVEREGKSTTAANLAIAEARSGRHVALVDLDLRRPYIDRFFRLIGAPGIADVVLGTVDLEHALQPIDLGLGSYANSAPSGSGNGSGAAAAPHGLLDVLVSGPTPPDPGEFVASERVKSILVRLHESYDTVIIDSPPVLRVGDALALSADADGVILVARMKGLRRPMLREMRRLLSAAPIRKLGFVVTGTVPGQRDAYGDAYSYGYGYKTSAPSGDAAAGQRARSRG
jgi:polysaccharide biosynthesis transport protein